MNQERQEARDRLITDLAVIVHDLSARELPSGSVKDALARVRRELASSWGDSRDDTERKLSLRLLGATADIQRQKRLEGTGNSPYPDRRNRPSPFI